MSTHIHAAHMEVLVPEKRRKYLKQAKKAFRRSKLEFDSIAFSGMSGAVFAPILAHILKKEIIMVRKGVDMPERGHSSFGVEGYAAAKRYVIVDDLVSTGATAKYIHGHIRQDFAPDAKCVGVYCYLTDAFQDAGVYPLGDVIYRESSVPKIAPTDDPTVLRDTPPCGCTVAQSCADCAEPKLGPVSSLSYDSERKMFVGKINPGFVGLIDAGEVVDSASGRFTSVSDIPDGVDMEDVPSEPDAVNFPFSF